MSRLDPHIEVLEEHVVAEDAFTLTSYARVRIGDPAKRWFKPLVVREIRPVLRHDRSLARRFRDRINVLLPASFHPNTFGIVRPPGDIGSPIAVFECFAGYWLHDVLAARRGHGLMMPRPIVEHVLASVEAGLRAMHQVRLPHGDLAASRVYVTYDGTVKVEVGAPWDPRANFLDDWRRFATLRGELLAAAEQGLEPGPDDLVAFTRRVLGDPGFPVGRTP